MTTQDRGALLEQVARRMCEAHRSAIRLSPAIWPEDFPSYERVQWRAAAEIALSLAEATREDIAKWHDEQEEQKMEESAAYRAAGMPEVAREAFRQASHHHACAQRIRARPITLAPKQETDHG
jgi:hypothetical protein